MSGQAFNAYLQGNTLSADMFVQPEKAILTESDEKRPVRAREAIDKGQHILPAKPVYRFSVQIFDDALQV